MLGSTDSWYTIFWHICQYVCLNFTNTNFMTLVSFFPELFDYLLFILFLSSGPFVPLLKKEEMCILALQMENSLSESQKVNKLNTCPPTLWAYVSLLFTKGCVLLIPAPSRRWQVVQEVGALCLLRLRASSSFPLLFRASYWPCPGMGCLWTAVSQGWSCPVWVCCGHSHTVGILNNCIHVF